MDPPPSEAMQILQRGSLAYVAADGSDGPHLTPVVFVEHSGRLWVTTSRGSRKARIWAYRPDAAALVRHGARAVSLRGSVSRYDALDPATWPDAIVRSPALGRAWLRFSLKNARFFAGYARDAHRVPLSWTPPGRILASIDLDAGAVLEDEGPARAWGQLGSGVSGRPSFRATRRKRPPDLGAPEDLRRRLGGSGAGALCASGREGLVVLPVRWARVGEEGAFYAVLPRATMALAGAGSQFPASLVVDRASWWRAAKMMGLQARGQAEVYLPDEIASGARSLDRHASLAGWVPEDPAIVRLRPRRIVWWKGWSSGTV